jgi:hypothetical protein
MKNRPTPHNLPWILVWQSFHGFGFCDSREELILLALGEF